MSLAFARDAKKVYAMEIVDAVQNLVRAEAEKGTTAAEMADRVTAESIGEHLYKLHLLK